MKKLLKHFVRSVFAILTVPLILAGFVVRIIYRAVKVGIEEADIFIDWL